MIKGQHTQAEIASQPEIWTKTIEKLFAEKDELAAQLASIPTQSFIVTGCGSTYYLSLHIAAALRKKGFSAYAFPASELIFYPTYTYQGTPTLLVFSRSGTTTESLIAINRYREQFPNGKIISITCVPETPMIAQSDIAITAPDAVEISVAQTRSFTSMTVAGHFLIALLAKDDKALKIIRTYPDILRNLFTNHLDLAESIGSNAAIERLFFLGSGPFYGIASEAMLKTKEMSSSWAEVFHVMEFRHGPMSVVNHHSVIFGLISETGAEAEIKVLKEMGKKGATTIAFIDERDARDWNGIDHVIPLHTHGEEAFQAIHALPLIQWVAFYRSLARGMDPDNPTNLTQVIVLDE